MKSFFLDKFEYDFRCNQQWCQSLLKQEDHLSDYIRKSMSHIINVHHIWISRIAGMDVESHSWDQLPAMHWEQLSQDNYNRTVAYLEELELTEKINYHDEQGIELSKDVTDILYHILNHSNYHRAQISRELRTLELHPPSFNFIAYH